MNQLVHNSISETPTSDLRPPNLQRRSRSGISIIEVMTAVVVAMIGVFGTLVLIPFAVKQAQSGLDLDDGRNLAENSIASFDAMGFGDPETWVSGFAITDLAAPPPNNAPTSQLVLAPSFPLLIDPLWINENNIGPGPSLDANVGESVTPQMRNNFGFFGDGVLRTDPDGPDMLSSRSIFSRNGTPPGTYPLHGQVHPALPTALRISRVSLTNGANVLPITDVLAQRLFQSTDALSFSKFGAEEIGANGEPLGGQPFQIFDRDGTGNILRRQTTGGRLSQAMFIIPGEDQQGGVYRRVTLIFADRELTLYSDPGGDRDFANSNPRALMASALVTTRGAIPGDLLTGIQSAGREIVICPVVWGGGADPTPNQMFTNVLVGTPEAPGVRRDDWVMMINRLPPSYPVGGLPARQQIQFFRVANIDEGNENGGTPNDLPSLTLDGPSFDFGPTGGVSPTYIVHLRDVVNVYEDTISL